MQDLKIVSGKEAESLLRCSLDKDGPRAFAQRTQQYPGGARIEFGGVDFESLRHEFEDNVLRFENLQLNHCEVDFSGADFGDGGVSFSGCQAGRPASFAGARFGNGDVKFIDSQWGTIDFSEAIFMGGGTLDFSGAKVNGNNLWTFIDLGEKDLNFATSSKGRVFEASGKKFFISIKRHTGKTVSFQGAILRSHLSSFNFEGATGLKQLQLNDSVWQGRAGVVQNLCFQGSGSLQLCRADLSMLQEFTISKVSVKKGLVRFATTVFPGQGLTRIGFEKIGNSKVDFENAVFGGALAIAQEAKFDRECEVSFKGATFQGPVEISNLSFGSVPNFIATQFSKHLSLDGVEYDYERAKRLFSPDPNNSNAGKLQRLKELAENNRDHRLALQCYADEMRARRWQLRNMGSKAADVLDATYDLISSYGQSVARPFIALVLTWFVFAGLYGEASTVKDTPAFLDMLGYSMAMSVPFLPASSAFRANEFLSLFGDPASADMSSVYGLMAGQGLVSFVLLFLIGLGLRNRFRI